MKKRLILFVMVSFLLTKGGNYMLELIKPTDTLAEGYPKINAAIQKADQAFVVADNAVDTANNALAVANQSLANSQSVQEQLNQVVINGDSSVEAAQARVNADNTVTYDTLKERLDTEYIELSTELANKADKSEIDINNRPYRKLLPALDNWEFVTDAIINDQTWKDRYAGVGYDIAWDEATQKYAMLYCGAETGGTTRFGIAYSDDLLTWTDYEDNPIFVENPIAGTPDAGGITYPQLIRLNNKWYMYYIGFPEPGYEIGIPSICYATADNLLGPWTRHGAVVTRDMFPEEYDINYIYRPTVFKVGNTWYMFTNAGTNIGYENIWYLTAPSVEGPWTVGEEVIKGTQLNTANGGHIASDPEIVRFGDWFIMFTWSNGGMHVAYCDASEFPDTWHPIDEMINIPGYPQRACFVDSPYGQYLFLNTNYAKKISIYKQAKGYEKFKTATLQNGWTSENGVKYRKNMSNEVILQGIATGGTVTPGTVIFNLPEGYRPSETVIFPITTSDGTKWNIGTVNVWPDGRVTTLGTLYSNGIAFNSVRFVAR